LLACKPDAPVEPTLREKMNMKMAELEQATELGSVEYVVKKVVKATDEAKWYQYGDRKILFGCTAYLKAGVDLSNFTSENVVIDEEQKSIVVTLPHAKLLSINMPPSETKLLYEQVPTFRGNFTAAESNGLLQQGEEDVLNQVKDLGILADAEKNAKDFFKAMLGQMGFSVITVKFE
jgi:hypothetical protein